MTLGSLFDGAGTFPFAGSVFGIVPVWASEIEAFPIKVTQKRFPKMQHLGDVTKIKGDEITPVDIITFGSPCQDLSVAGRRAGLDGERSGLFMEAVRIIKEMREKTNGKYPKYAIWENVPGAFSSNKGEDFRIVLEELCKIKDNTTAIPRPTDGKWRTAGFILADGYSLAWRILDAQFWGVPQRRRRIFLVADFTGGSAGEILFEQKGLQRSFAESRKAWNGITPNTTYCAYSTGGIDGSGIARTTAAPPPVISLNNHPNDSRVTVSKDNLVQTLSSNMGTGGNNTPLLLLAKGVDTLNQCLTGDKARTLLAGHIDKDGVPCVALNILQDAISGENTTPCLSTGNPKTGQANLAVCMPYLLLDDQGGGNIRTEANAKNAPTLRAQDHGHPPCLCYSIDRAAFNQGENAQFNIGISDKGIAHTLVAKGPGAVCHPVGIHGDKAGTLDASYFKGCGERNGTEREIIACMLKTKWVVRRTTPTECARLQGMPDWWCNGVVHKDAPEYKMWGNGMALPCVLFVMQGIAKQLRKQLLQKIGGNR